MILWGLIELVCLFHNTPSRPFYGGTKGCHCQGACCPQWFLCPFQIEMGQTLTWLFDSRGIHSPLCWEPGFNTNYTMPGRYATHYTIYTSLNFVFLFLFFTMVTHNQSQNECVSKLTPSELPTSCRSNWQWRWCWWKQWRWWWFVLTNIS